jgi:hypothetical protein
MSLLQVIGEERQKRGANQRPNKGQGGGGPAGWAGGRSRDLSESHCCAHGGGGSDENSAGDVLDTHDDDDDNYFIL